MLSLGLNYSIGAFRDCPKNFFMSVAHGLVRENEDRRYVTRFGKTLDGLNKHCSFKFGVDIQLLSSTTSICY